MYVLCAIEESYEVCRGLNGTWKELHLQHPFTHMHVQEVEASCPSFQGWDHPYYVYNLVVSWS